MELAQAIRSIYKGYNQLGPGLWEKANPATNTTVKTPPEIAELTTREQEVLKLIAKGYSDREIAEKLCLTELNVKNHLNSILRRLNLSGLSEAEALRGRTQAAIFVYNHH